MEGIPGVCGEGCLMDPIQIAGNLAHAVDTLPFGHPVARVYNPLVYAWAPHAQYLERYSQGDAGRLAGGHESRAVGHGSDRCAFW